MNCITRTILLTGLTVVALATSSRAVTPPPGVTVTYALVPKARLSEAVKSEAAAFQIETEWRKETMAEIGPVPYLAILNQTHYSIVVFVRVPSGIALWGRIGIPVQNTRTPLIVNVTLSPGYSGTYVVDGGGVVLRGLPAEPKPYEWLEIHTK